MTDNTFLSDKMGKELIKIVVERDNLNQKWGIVIQELAQSRQ